MKRGLFGLLIMVVAFGGLILASGLTADSMVSGSGKDRLLAAMQGSLGVPVIVGDARLDRVPFCLLRPAISLQDIANGNLPGLRSRDLLEAEKQPAQVALFPLLRKIIEVRSLDIDYARIFTETDAQGVRNIEALLKKTKSRSSSRNGAGSGAKSSFTTASGESSGTGLLVDEISVTSGEIVLAPGQAREEGGGIPLTVRGDGRIPAVHPAWVRCYITSPEDWWILSSRLADSLFKKRNKQEKIHYLS